MIKIKETKYLFNLNKVINLLNELYPHKQPNELKKGLKLLRKQKDFHLIVAYDKSEAVAISCINSGYLLYCEKYLQISSLYIKPDYRNLGIAQNLFKKAVIIAKKTKASKIVLDSYITNNDSHKTYFRENFSINAYHFVKEL